MSIKMIDQFKMMDDKRKIAKEKLKSKGPIDLKAGREQVKDWNKKNRTP